MFAKKKTLLKNIVCGILISSAAISATGQTHLVFDDAGNIKGSYVVLPENKMQTALSGVIQQANSKRGFSGLDPRAWGTVIDFGKTAGAAAGTAAVVTVGAITAPSWGSVVLAMGVGSIVSYFVSLALDGLVNWLFRGDGKIDIKGEDKYTQIGGMSAGGSYCRSDYRGSNFELSVSGGDCEAVARQVHYDRWVKEYQSLFGGTYTQVTCSASDGGIICGNISAVRYPSGAPASCPSGSRYSDGKCSNYTFLDGGSGGVQQAATLQEATEALTTQEKVKPLNPQIMAALVNKGWQQAASQPGYQGLPYPYANPVTTAEVDQWMKNNPDGWPTVGDFVNPNPNLAPTSGQSQPSGTILPQNPSTITNPSASTGTGGTGTTSTKVDLGPDPNIGAPNLEEIPSAQKILQPILDLMPSLKNFQVNTPPGTCPRPVIDLYGHHVMSAHCDLIDNNKTLIQAAMVFAWAVVALFVILSA